MIGLRQAAALFGLAVATLAHAHAASEAATVRLVVPHAIGSDVDIVARLIAPGLREALGEPVRVDNRPGAGGLTAGALVARAPPDGTTLLVGSNGPVLHGPRVYAQARYRWDRDFAVVGAVSFAPMVLLGMASLPATSVDGLIRLAQATPGQLTMATPGAGSAAHLASELLQSVAKARWATVHYKGSPQALTDLLGQRVQLGFGQVPPAAPLVRDGRLLALAVTAPQRVDALPGVPTFAEAGLRGFEISTFVGLFAPAGTSVERIYQLNAALARVLQDEPTARRLAAVGAQPRAMRPDDFLEWLKREDERWLALIRDANITAN